MLPPIDDVERFVRSRRDLHAVAEHVLAAHRFRTDGKIRLIPDSGGFASPYARVEGATLVTAADPTSRVPLTSLRDVASALGIEPGLPEGIYQATPMGPPDAPLHIDVSDAWVIAGWLFAGRRALEGVAAEFDDPTDVVLWPEHFDVALSAGSEAAGRRANFGASPGDAGHPEPYAYVGPWAPPPGTPESDSFWNATTFHGALRPYADIRDAADPVAALIELFRRGWALLALA
jgi:hypothetical protein